MLARRPLVKEAVLGSPTTTRPAPPRSGGQLRVGAVVEGQGGQGARRSTPTRSAAAARAGRTISDRNCFAAIVFMARTSTPWRLLPAREFGCGSPATCWRRLTEWAKAGVFDQLHLEVLDRLGEQGRLDWSRASVDTMSVRARRGGSRWRTSRRSRQAWEQAAAGLRRWWAAAAESAPAAHNVGSIRLGAYCLTRTTAAAVVCGAAPVCGRWAHREWAPEAGRRSRGRGRSSRRG
jgi:transposase